MIMQVPEYIKNIIEKLERAGFEAYIVGGCVRDLLMGLAAKDWDITTNARPEKILEIFPEGKYENIFGTVLVPIKLANGETEDVVEVTTYRSEQGYSDRRHPDGVRFEDKLEKDLARRDFTINAMALRRPLSLPLSKGEKRIPLLAKEGLGEVLLVDLFGGGKEIGR